MIILDTINELLESKKGKRPLSVSFNEVYENFEGMPIKTLKKAINEHVIAGRLFFYFNVNREVYFYTNEKDLT